LRTADLDARERIEGWIMLMAMHLARADLTSYESAAREVHELARPFADSAPLGRLGERSSAYLLLSLLAAITGCVIRGRLAEAAQRLAALPAASARLGVAHARRSDIHGFVVGRWLAAYRGQVEGVEAFVDAHMTASPSARWQGQLWKMQLALQRGATVAAREHFAQLRESDFEPVVRGYQLPARVVHLAEIADACTFAGCQADAEVLYERLLPHAETALLDGVMISWGACSRVLGALAIQLERSLEAERHLQHALGLNARFEHRPELLRTRLALARLYRRSGKERDAEALLARAQADASDMGMAGFAFERGL
jgi:tetratricopeptide (TPR) repeat protein